MDFIKEGNNNLNQENIINNGDNIWCASSDGDIIRVRELLDCNINVNVQDETGYSPM